MPVSERSDGREKTCPLCGGQGCDECEWTGSVPLDPMPVSVYSAEQDERLFTAAEVMAAIRAVILYERHRAEMVLQAAIRETRL